MTRIWNLPHLAGINEIKVRLMRACKELGFEFRFWMRSEDLAPLLASQQLIPDGYAQTRREVDDELKAQPPRAILNRTLWAAPGQSDTVSLFQLELIKSPKKEDYDGTSDGDR